MSVGGISAWIAPLVLVSMASGGVQEVASKPETLSILAVLIVLSLTGLYHDGKMSVRLCLVESVGILPVSASSVTVWMPGGRVKPVLGSLAVAACMKSCQIGADTID